MIMWTTLPRCIIYTLTRTVGDGEELLLEWLPEAWEEQWPRLSEVEMPDLLWQMVEEGI